VDKYNVNTNIVPMDILRKAVDIEFEHKDIIGLNPDKAFKIAMAHLREYPDYYQRLIKLESKANEYWRGKIKPSIYTNGTRASSTEIRSARIKTETSGPKRPKRSDLYGVRKGTRARRTTHIYSDYISKQTPIKSQQEIGQSKTQKHVSWRASEDRGVQTGDVGP